MFIEDINHTQLELLIHFLPFQADATCSLFKQNDVDKKNTAGEQLQRINIEVWRTKASAYNEIKSKKLRDSFADYQ